MLAVMSFNADDAVGSGKRSTAVPLRRFRSDWDTPLGLHLVRNYA